MTAPTLKRYRCKSCRRWTERYPAGSDVLLCECRGELELIVAKPLTPATVAVLRVLCAALGRLTPNEIGGKLGYRTGGLPNRHARDGRAMGPANRVIGCLNALGQRGYLDRRPRLDGLSGTAFEVNRAGREAFAALERDRIAKVRATSP